MKASAAPSPGTVAGGLSRSAVGAPASALSAPQETAPQETASQESTTEDKQIHGRRPQKKPTIDFAEDVAEGNEIAHDVAQL